MDKWEYQNKPCYLENRVVRELCKWRTACVGFIQADFDIELAFKTKSHKHYSKQEGFKILSIFSLSIFLSFPVLPDGFHHFSDSLAHLDVTRLSKKASYWLDHTAMQCSPQRWRKLNKFVGSSFIWTFPGNQDAIV